MSRIAKHPMEIVRGQMMKNVKWSTGTAIMTLLIGVMLLWSFGKDWLHFESPVVFLAGLIGVAIPVLVFAAWKIYHDSHEDDE